MKFVLATAAALCLATAVFAEPNRPGSYNDLVQRGNIAAQAGDFDSAISYWRKAIPLDPTPDKKCRGDVLRTSIKAAQNTMSMLQQGKIRKEEAPSWFRNDNTELWMPSPCNSN